MLRDYVGTGPALTAYRDDRGNGFLLFKNPRGIWQLSRFSPDVGPVGHQEGTPEELTKDVMFYRPDDGGYVDSIMENMR
jgi:hypothetical protein